MLRLDFYESSIGETVVITFPDGGIGIVDAHPSQTSSRQAINQLVNGQRVHFVCLTHPHTDHGADLLPIIQGTSAVTEFWHTIPQVDAFFYGITEFENYPSPVMDVAKKIQETTANLFIDLFHEIDQKSIPTKKLRAEIRPIVIGEVEIHVLSPSELTLRKFEKSEKKRLLGEKKHSSDPNLLSAVLALKYGDATILLCGDALKENWTQAVPLYKELRLPKAGLIKIPHHGASNALLIHPRAGQVSYLELCSKSPLSYGVLFAGSSNHPDAAVFDKIRQHTILYCLANGLKKSPANPNPLGLTLLGAVPVASSGVCNSVVSFEVDNSGKFSLVQGVCPKC